MLMDGGIWGADGSERLGCRWGVGYECWGGKELGCAGAWSSVGVQGLGGEWGCGCLGQFWGAWGVLGCECL